VFIDVAIEYNLFYKRVTPLEFITAQQLRIFIINNILLFSCCF